jgi:hypothetical protein
LGDNEVDQRIAKVKNAETREERDYPLDTLYSDFALIYEELM